MPGVPGKGGPTPKRDDQRRRRNAPETPITQAPGTPGVAPPASEKWHEAARRWYESLAQSGQSAYYQQSDWETAWILAESLSRELKPQVIGTNPETGEPTRASVPIKGASLTAYLKAMTDLMVTEGARRRASLELQAQAHAEAVEDSDVSRIDDARRRLSG